MPRHHQSRNTANSSPGSPAPRLSRALLDLGERRTRQAGLVVAPGGRLQLALSFTIGGAKIVAYELIADPGRLQGLDLAVIDA